MPHYEDGTQAKNGDLVIGKTYNLHGRTIVGTVLEIIPGSDSCNVRVAFADVLTRPDSGGCRPSTVGDCGIVYSSSHTLDHPRMVIKPAYDYGETKAFKLLARSDA